MHRQPALGQPNNKHSTAVQLHVFYVRRHIFVFVEHVEHDAQAQLATSKELTNLLQIRADKQKQFKEYIHATLHTIFATRTTNIVKSADQQNLWPDEAEKASKSYYEQRKNVSYIYNNIHAV